MGLYTGLRKKAILSLRWPQVDLERGVQPSVKRFADTAEFQLLMEDASRGGFDLVYAEALDRISRDQEDSASPT